MPPRVFFASDPIARCGLNALDIFQPIFGMSRGAATKQGPGRLEDPPCSNLDTRAASHCKRRSSMVGINYLFWGEELPLGPRVKPSVYNDRLGLLSNY